MDAPLAFGIPCEQPLGCGHLFEVQPFGPGLGLPLGFEIGPELLVFLGVFGREQEGHGHGGRR